MGHSQLGSDGTDMDSRLMSDNNLSGPQSIGPRWDRSGQWTDVREQHEWAAVNWVMMGQIWTVDLCQKTT